MALVLITHDMGVVAETAHRIMVMYAGQQMEMQPAASLFERPRHPYTAALLDSLPERSSGHKRLSTIPGVVPGVEDRPTGCLFSPRCSYADDRCRQVMPGITIDAQGHEVRCLKPLNTPSVAAVS